MEQINIKLPKWLKEKLYKYVEAQGRTVSDFVRYLIKKALEK